MGAGSSGPATAIGKVKMNYARTALLLAALTGLFLAVGYMIGGEGGMVIALAIAGAMNLFAYWNSDSMVLSMSHAEEVDPSRAPALYDMTRQLAERAGLPMPRLYVLHEDQPNAFATGRNPENAAVAVTTGLMDRLSSEELAGVIAHELGHIRNRDTLIMTITATLAGALGMLANMAMFAGHGRSDEEGRGGGLGVIGGILVMILAPLAASLVQMAISRSREYEADALGAAICGNPLWLASALERIHAHAQVIPNRAAEANPATSHLYIENPLSGGGLASLFSTHPSTEDRVARLQEMARTYRSSEYRSATVAPPSPSRRRGPWG